MGPRCPFSHSRRPTVPWTIFPRDCIDHRGERLRAIPTLVALPKAFHPVPQTHSPITSGESFMKRVEFLRPVKGRDIEFAEVSPPAKHPDRPTGSPEYSVKRDGETDWEMIRGKVRASIVHRRLPML